MSLLRRGKAGQATNEVMKWILWIAILVAAGFAIRMVIFKFAS